MTRLPHFGDSRLREKSDIPTIPKANRIRGKALEELVILGIRQRQRHSVRLAA